MLQDCISKEVYDLYEIAAEKNNYEIIDRCYIHNQSQLITSDDSTYVAYTVFHDLNRNILFNINQYTKNTKHYTLL